MATDELTATFREKYMAEYNLTNKEYLTLIKKGNTNPTGDDADIAETIKKRYSKSEVTFAEFIVHQVFNDSHTRDELMQAINELYEWDREEPMPISHNFGVVRIEAGWIVVEKPVFQYIDEGEVFGSAIIKFQSDRIPEGTLNQLTTEIVAFKANEREFYLFQDKQLSMRKNNEVTLIINFKELDEIEGELKHFKHDLTLSDLDAPDLTATIKIVNEGDHKLEDALIEGNIFVKRPDKPSYHLALTLLEQ